jgi:hypothetical protein
MRNSSLVDIGLPRSMVTLGRHRRKVRSVSLRLSSPDPESIGMNASREFEWQAANLDTDRVDLLRVTH